MITEKQIKRDYVKLNKIIVSLTKKKKYFAALDLISFAGKLMYKYNVFFSDLKLESILESISNNYFSSYSAEENKVVLFYDYWGLETRGLTNIYLRALLKLDFKIIYITQKHNSIHTEWIESLFGNTNSTIYYINSLYDYQNTFNLLDELNRTYKPQFAFFHSAPEDVTGVCFFYSIKSKKYLINLTDEAFWFGTNCTDYVLEFRDYGYSLSVKERHIQERKLLVQPYYPIISRYEITKETEINLKSLKKFIFSGGSVYKIKGSNVFLDIVSFFLYKYTDLSFVFLSNGDKSEIVDYFKKKHLIDRVLLLNESIDFCEYMKNCVFYLDTYPIIGGLMNQYAVLNSTIPLSLNLEKNNYCNESDISGLFINYNESLNLSFNSVEKLQNEGCRIIEDIEYSNVKKDNIKKLLLDDELFSKNLFTIMNTDKSNYSCKICNINNLDFTKQCITSENTSNKNYYVMFAKSKNKYVYINYLPYVIKGIFLFVRRKLCKFHF